MKIQKFNENFESGSDVKLTTYLNPDKIRVERRANKSYAFVLNGVSQSLTNDQRSKIEDLLNNSSEG